MAALPTGRHAAPCSALAFTLLTLAASSLSVSRSSRTPVFCLHPSLSLYIPPPSFGLLRGGVNPPAGDVAAVDRHAIFTANTALGGLLRCHGAVGRWQRCKRCLEAKESMYARPTFSSRYSSSPRALSHPLTHNRLSFDHNPILFRAPPSLQRRPTAVSARRPALVVVAPDAALRGSSVSAWKVPLSIEPVAIHRAYAAHRLVERLPATSCNSSS